MLADGSASASFEFPPGCLDPQPDALTARAGRTNSTAAERKWAQKLGPVGPLALLLAKGKFLLSTVFKLKFLLSFVAFFGFYWAAFGMKFGLGFAVLILIHELGHYIDFKRRGLPADNPVFLPGFGAYVRSEVLGVPIETRADISLAGPFAGFLASVACALIWYQTQDSIWAALAYSGAWLNLLNLIPVWVLDGGHAVLALGKTERFILLMACLGLWLTLNEKLFLPGDTNEMSLKLQEPKPANARAFSGDE
jgi:Zn-dependent protease